MSEAVNLLSTCFNVDRNTSLRSTGLRSTIATQIFSVINVRPLCPKPCQTRRLELAERASGLQRWAVALSLEATRQQEAAKALRDLENEVQAVAHDGSHHLPIMFASHPGIPGAQDPPCTTISQSVCMKRVVLCWFAQPHSRQETCIVAKSRH